MSGPDRQIVKLDSVKILSRAVKAVDMLSDVYSNLNVLSLSLSLALSHSRSRARSRALSCPPPVPDSPHPPRALSLFSLTSHPLVAAEYSCIVLTSNKR